MLNRHVSLVPVARLESKQSDVPRSACVCFTRGLRASGRSGYRPFPFCRIQSTACDSGKGIFLKPKDCHNVRGLIESTGQCHPYQ